MCLLPALGEPTSSSYRSCATSHLQAMPAFTLLKVMDGLTGSMFGYTAYDLRCGTTPGAFAFAEAIYPKKE
jgi:hypothetical protein